MPDLDKENQEKLPRDTIIDRFQEWWTPQEIEQLLKNPDICDTAFFPNIEQMKKSGRIELDHKEYATILFDQVGGEKFLHAKKVAGNFVFLAEVFRAVVKNSPSKEEELRSAINDVFYSAEKLSREAEDIEEWKQLGIIDTGADSTIQKEFNYNFLDTDFHIRLENTLKGQRGRSPATSSKFLLTLCEIMRLPDVCGQKSPKEPERKTEDIEPVGDLNPLYDYQRDVSRKIDNILTHYSDKTSRAIVALPTGSGKTRIVVESIIRWINNGKPGQDDKKFIVWMVDKKELCQQAFDTFKSIFQAIGKQDTTLRLNVFWGTSSKNMSEIVKADPWSDVMDASRRARTSIIIATVPSLTSIIRREEDRNEKDKSISQIGKKLALVVIDEAHHASPSNKSYTNVLHSIGFNFSKNEVHPQHARLLGLTATPFLNEKIVPGQKHQTRTQALLNRFGGSDCFFWPDLENSSITTQVNPPHAILELQKSATFGNDVKVSGERSFDQDGNIDYYYWQIKRVASNHSIRQTALDENDKELLDSYTSQSDETKATKDDYRYDTGRDLYGLDSDPSKNLEQWKKEPLVVNPTKLKVSDVVAKAKSPTEIDVNWTAPTHNRSIITKYKVERSEDSTNWDVLTRTHTKTTYNDSGLVKGPKYSYRIFIVPPKETPIKWIDKEIFNEIGEYQVSLWVKDDDGLVSQKDEMRTIVINKPVEKSITDNQHKMQFIEKQLIEQKILAIPKRWSIKHDSVAYMKRLGRRIEFKTLTRKDKKTGRVIVTQTSILTPESAELISRDAELNEKIIAVVDKLIKEEHKESILLFTNSVSHAKLISSLLRSSIKPRINAQYIHGETHTDERCKFISDFRERKIQVLCNVDILTTGFDAPEVDAVVVARNPESYPLWVQMIGRGLRGPRNGGTLECRIVDFGMKLRDESSQLSEEEKLLHFRFHMDLFDEDKELDDYDLGIVTDETMKWQNDSQKRFYNEWREKHALGKHEIRTMHKLFSEHTVFKKWKPEFWTWLDKNYQHHTVDEIKSKAEFDDEGNLIRSRTRQPNPDFSIIDDEDDFSNIETSVSTRTFPNLLSVVRCWELKLPRKNYKPIIVKSLVNGPRSIAELCNDLLQANPTDTTMLSAESYTYIQAFSDLVNENIVRKQDDTFELNVIPLDKYQKDELIEKMDQMIVDVKRSEAAKKANVTRGEEGRSEASRKAWDTRRENQTEEEQDTEIAPKSYSEFIQFCDKNLNPETLKANYQPVMMKYLLEYGPSNRTLIARELQKKNLDNRKDLNFFKNVPVYDVLVNHKIVKKIKMNEPSSDIFELNIEKGHKNKILQKLVEILDGYEVSAKVFAKCPNCGKTVKSFQDVQKDFGFRNIDGITRPQSWCRICRKK